MIRKYQQKLPFQYLANLRASSQFAPHARLIHAMHGELTIQQRRRRALQAPVVALTEQAERLMLRGCSMSARSAYCTRAIRVVTIETDGLQCFGEEAILLKAVAAATVPDELLLGVCKGQQDGQAEQGVEVFERNGRCVESHYRRQCGKRGLGGALWPSQCA